MEDPYEIDIDDLSRLTRNLRSLFDELDGLIRQDDPGGAELSYAVLLMDDLSDTVKSFITKRREHFENRGW